MVRRVVYTVPFAIALIQIGTATNRVGLNPLNGKGKLAELEAIGKLNQMPGVVASGIFFGFFRTPMYKGRWLGSRNP